MLRGSVSSGLQGGSDQPVGFVQEIVTLFERLRIIQPNLRAG
jgi:hypothetical protein